MYSLKYRKCVVRVSANHGNSTTGKANLVYYVAGYHFAKI